MTDPDLTAQQRRQAVAETLVEIAAPAAEEIVRTFLERTAGSPNDWDARFLELVKAPDARRLLHATAGDGITVIFSPEQGRGFWLMDQAALRGKGFLSTADVERLSALPVNARAPKS